MGGGIEFYATENVTVGIDVSYILPTGDLDGIEFYSIGLLQLGYRF